MTPTNIRISEIRVPAARRRLDPAWVETLQQDMIENGHMVPIEVAPENGGYRLIFGGHRLAAVVELGRTEIAAFVKDADQVATESQIRMREIAENLIRRELSVLDRAVDIADWRNIYNATQANGKAGRKPKNGTEGEDEASAKFALNFTEAAQRALRISRRSVFLALKVATIPPSIRRRIALHPIADSQSDLLVLAGEPADRQAEIADLLLSEPAKADNVAAAIAILDSTPAPVKLTQWQKVSTAFSQLKAGDQDRFFALHESAIQRWMKGRAS